MEFIITKEIKISVASISIEFKPNLLKTLSDKQNNLKGVKVKQMSNYFNYLKQKWGIESHFQFWLIFGIFAISGTSTLFVKEPIFVLFGIDEMTPFWIKFLVYILTITPAYFTLLIVYGTLLGQNKFFSRFIRNFMVSVFFIRGNRRKNLLIREKSNPSTPDQ